MGSIFIVSSVVLFLVYTIFFNAKAHTIDVETHVELLRRVLSKHQFKYCISTRAYEIFTERLKKCLSVHSISNSKMKEEIFKELKYLYDTNDYEYSTSHELHGFYYFVLLSDENPYYTASCNDADFEYIPLLPLVHRTGLQSHTECSAGGECNHYSSTNGTVASDCDIKHVVNSILEYQQYKESMIVENNSVGNVTNKQLQTFTMVSSFNLKTMLAYGFTDEEAFRRRGQQYEMVSRFIESMYLGHYERIVQCADVLRRPWKYVVEMPYIVHAIEYRSHLHQIMDVRLKQLKDFISGNPQYADRDQAESEGRSVSNTRPPFKYAFYYVGDMELWGPERVCSVTTSLYDLASPRRLDTYIRHVGSIESNSVVKNHQLYAETGLQSSIFCLIPTSNSYSTSLFYQAIAHGCIPVVISDWYALPYKWYIPYDEFVVRISEEDFKASPNAALDSVREYYLDCPDCMERIAEMWRKLEFWSELLLLPETSVRTLGLDVNKEPSAPSPVALPNPMLLMLVEMVVAHQHLKHHKNPQTMGHIKNIPNAYSYMSYSELQEKLGLHKRKQKDRDGQALGGDRVSEFHDSNENEVSQSLWNRLWSLPPLSLICISPYASDCVGHVAPLPIYVTDRQMKAQSADVDLVPSHKVDHRPFMCQHTPGLIGKYKIVYFMQCVRVLWSNFNGKAHGKLYQKLSPYEKHYVNRFHNITRNEPNGMLSEIYNNASSQVVIYKYYPTIPRDQYSTVHSLVT